MCVHVRVSVSLGWDVILQSSLDVFCQQSDGCWGEAVLESLPVGSDTLWVMMPQHPTRASPPKHGVTGVMWVLKNGFYFVPAAIGVQAVSLCAVLMIL